MQYPYLTLLYFVATLLTLSIGIIIFYLLVRLFDKTAKFLTALKGLLMYELSSLILYLIYPTPFLCKIFNNNDLKLKILDLFLFSTILFCVFYFIMKKTLLIKWKKSLILFLIVVFLLFPTLGSLELMFVNKIISLPIFAKEFSQIEAQTKEYIREHGIFGHPLQSLALKITGSIVGGMFFGPTIYLGEIIMTISFGI